METRTFTGTINNNNFTVDDILKVVTTPSERLIKYHMYYGHKVIDYTFDGYTDDDMNKVLLVLDDGHIRTEYLYDDEFSEFTESFD